MYRHNILLFILTLQLRNIRLVSTFKETCSETKTYSYQQNIDYYYDQSKDHFQYIIASTQSDCQKLCDKDAKCSQFFYSSCLKGCYLSQCKKSVTCNNTLSICSSKRDCPWIGHTKGL